MKCYILFLGRNGTSWSTWCCCKYLLIFDISLGINLFLKFSRALLAIQVYPELQVQLVFLDVK
jgi:hypothetical protein